MDKANFELTLRDISLKEHFLRQDSYETVYANYVTLLFQNNKGLLSTADVLKAHGETKMDAVFEKYPDRYFCPESGVRNGSYIRKWVDLWSSYVVKRNDKYHDYFFALKLSHLDLMEIDVFLDYQLENHFDDQVKDFSRFLEVLLRKYKKEELLEADYRRTVKEWAENKKTDEAAKAKIKTKGKKVRLADDDGTCLTQEQTTLLISYLQRLKIIRSEENLRNKEAGEAFSMLTGYSADTIRQTLSKTELQRIATKENLKKLEAILTKIGIEINNDRQTKK